MLNVRLKFCTVPPRLKSLLKLPSDRHLLQQLEQCIRNLLSNEKEPDVCNAVREVWSYRYSRDLIVNSPLKLLHIPCKLVARIWC